MNDFENQPSFFDEEVKIIAFCPLCDADLNPIKAKIVEDNENMHLVHLQCNKCKGYILAVVLRTVNGLSSVGLITDLNYNDVYNFKGQEKISAEDVLNIHQEFNSKNIVKQIIS